MMIMISENQERVIRMLIPDIVAMKIDKQIGIIPMTMRIILDLITSDMGIEVETEVEIDEVIEAVVDFR